MFLTEWKVWGIFEDSFDAIVCGNTEQECMEKLCNISGHGNLVWYSGLTDDDYIDGELRRL